MKEAAKGPTTKGEYIHTYQKLINEGYAIHMFIKNDRVPEVVDEVFMDLHKYEGFHSFSLHRSMVEGNDKVIDYKGIFGEENYPFFLVISKDGIALQTDSAVEVEQYLDQTG